MLAMVGTALISAMVAAGCSQPRNPSFPISTVQARLVIRQMEKSPQEQVRPVVLLGGYLDPGLGTSSLHARLRNLFKDPKIVSVSYPLHGTFDACRDEVIRAVEKAWPSDDEAKTVEVDVIGVSMGGLVARYSAAAGAGQKQLNVKRLFTVSSPHRAASGAILPAITALHRDMRADSNFRSDLAEAERVDTSDYEIVPYVRLGDLIVGAPNASPQGQGVWWVSNPPLQSAHMGAPLDARIIADIARRLRMEEPLARGSPAPLPP
jgi:pimeloyl-ACP methyl ester carboxylesterase